MQNLQSEAAHFHDQGKSIHYAWKTYGPILIMVQCTMFDWYNFMQNALKNVLPQIANFTSEITKNKCWPCFASPIAVCDNLWCHENGAKAGKYLQVRQVNAKLTMIKKPRKTVCMVPNPSELILLDLSYLC